MTEKKIQKYLKEGRGTGSGEDFIPWVSIHDFPSIGRVHRIFGLKIPREYHFMSDGEAGYFDECDWDDEITDIREQFPLDRDLTYKIARQLKFKHPVTTDGTPNIMTTDFLLDVGSGTNRKLVARTLKVRGEVNKRRVLEKFEIEGRYWAHKKVDWGIVLKENLNKTLISNVEAVRGFADLTGLRGKKSGNYQKAAVFLIQMLGRFPNWSLRELCRHIDQINHFLSGTTLNAAKHLIAHKQLLTDMNDGTLLEQRCLSSFTLQSFEGRVKNGI